MDNLTYFKLIQRIDSIFPPTTDVDYGRMDAKEIIAKIRDLIFDFNMTYHLMT